MKKKKSTWGGARNTKSYSTTVVRVPDPVLPQVKKIVDAFRALSDKQKSAE